MHWLAKDPRTLFVGQSVRYDGTAMYASLADVPIAQRIEMPVIEDFQLGYCTGLALMGWTPVCCYPRMDFLLLAMNQLVNHLDKLPLFGWNPRVIIRTVVGPKVPLDAGPQHTQDLTLAVRSLLHNVVVLTARTPDEVRRRYEYAAQAYGSTLVVEYPGGR